eukprot:1160658-Pelagomonas_calceolata.AAC.6
MSSSARTSDTASHCAVLRDTADCMRMEPQDMIRMSPESYSAQQHNVRKKVQQGATHIYATEGEEGSL